MQNQIGSTLVSQDLQGGDNIGWRNIGVITYELFHACTFLDGSLYWMERSEGKVLADEEFRVISPSPCGGFVSYSSLHSLKILVIQAKQVWQQRERGISVLELELGVQRSNPKKV
ncbi:hypothetical protein C5167_005328 [Papaver somniferum]|uniref:Uncharacterized protein n=1 Tax=Papaver somniferum TaxID=3469 RepID=A0A4Y7JA96_PAPSO|nr:hypothetical protein C5167_005328 [Papaver somniferum]